MRTLRNNMKARVSRAAIESLEQRRLMTTFIVNFTASSDTAFMRYDAVNDGVYFDDGAGFGYLLSTSDNITFNVYAKQFGVADGIRTTSGNSMTVNLGDEDDNLTIDTAVPSAFGLRLNGGNDDDTINGGNGSDTISGDAGDDSLSGNAGNDRFLMGSSSDGADTMNGGTGTADIVDYFNRTAAITIDLSSAGGDGQAGENDNVATDVERLWGGSGNDVITGDGSAESLKGNGGNDTLNGAGGDDELLGGVGADSLDGGANNDSIGGGDTTDHTGSTASDDGDTLKGNTGNDLMYGDGGNDRFQSETTSDGADTLYGGNGSADIIDYGPRSNAVTINVTSANGDGEAGENDHIDGDLERLWGGSGNDVITGDGTAETLDGNGGNDTIRGNGGADEMIGDDGNDTFYVSDGSADTVTGGNGTDTLGDTADLVDVISL